MTEPSGGTPTALTVDSTSGEGGRVFRAALFLLGLALVCSGLAMVSVPLAMCVGGAAVAAIAVAMELAAQREPGEPE